MVYNIIRIKKSIDLPPYGMFLWGNSVDPIPLGLLIVLVAIPVVIIVCIIGVLIGRIREIDGGEEDEAAKY